MLSLHCSHSMVLKIMKFLQNFLLMVWWVNFSWNFFNRKWYSKCKRFTKSYSKYFDYYHFINFNFNYFRCDFCSWHSLFIKKKRQRMILLNNVPIINADIVTGVTLMIVFLLFFRIRFYEFTIITYFLLYSICGIKCFTKIIWNW